MEGNAVKNANNETLKVWNSCPETHNIFKKVTYFILSIFSLNYVCKSLFSIMNLIKSKQRNALMDATSAACVSLKTPNLITFIYIIFIYLIKRMYNIFVILFILKT